MDDFDRAPRDAWLKLKAGESVIMEIPDNKLSDIQNKIHRLRGGILSDSCNIENILDNILLHYFFDQPNLKENKKHQYFLNGVLRERMSLDKKLAFLKSLLPSFPDDFLKASEFHKSANEFRTIRNIFAHYPSWVEAVKEEDSDKIKLYKAFISKDGKQIFEINDEQINKWHKVIVTAIASGEDTIRYLSNSAKS